MPVPGAGHAGYVVLRAVRSQDAMTAPMLGHAEEHRALLQVVALPGGSDERYCARSDEASMRR